MKRFTGFRGSTTERKDEANVLLDGTLLLLARPSAAELTVTRLAPGATWRDRPGVGRTI